MSEKPLLKQNSVSVIDLYSWSNIGGCHQSKYFYYFVGGEKNVYKFFVRKPEGKRPLGRASEKLCGNIGLTCVLRKQSGRVWIGFVWLRISTSGTSRTYTNETMRLFKRFRVTYCLHCPPETNLSHWRLRQHVLPKRRNKLINFFYCYTVHVLELLNVYTNQCTYIKFIKFLYINL